MNIKKILLIPVCSILIAFSNSVNASVTINFSEYCPLHVGDTWLLVDEFGNTYSHEVVGTETLNGIRTYQYTNWDGNSGYANLGYDSGALIVFGLDDITLDPVRIYNGQDINNQFVHIVFDIEPTVETPVGIFQNVLKETIYEKVNGQETITRVQYFVKNIGLVKDENWCADCGGTYSNTALLSSYDVSSAPLADIKLNILGQTFDAPPSISFGTPISAEIAIIPWQQEGQEYEIWIAAQSPNGIWEWWLTPSGWKNNGAFPAYSGPLFMLPSFTIFSDISLPKGVWTFGIVLDQEVNGNLDMLDNIDILSVEVQ